MGRPLRVLVVEDSADDYELVLDALRDSGLEPSATRVETSDGLRAALQDDWELIVCDHSMPQLDAPAALSVLREQDRDLPFIIVSGTISEDDAVAAMRAGAHDYLLKSNLARLGPAVDRELLEATNRRRRRDAEARITYLAHHDALTGLPNRLSAQRQLDAEIAENQGRPFAIAVIGVERFQEVSGAFGARSAELLLAEVAGRLAEFAPRPVALVGEGRLAVLTLPTDGTVETSDLVAPLLAACRSPFFVHGNFLGITVRLAIARYPDHGTDGESLLRAADSALLLGRRSAQQVAEFSSGLREEHSARLSLLAHLQRAVDRNELSLDYQPKVDLRTGELRGLEALLRWKLHGHDSIPPSTFIPLAEQAGLVEQLTGWALREAATQISRWTEQGLPLAVSVNLSAGDLQSEESLATASNLVDGLPTGLLGFEVTESALIDDWVSARSALAGLRERGAPIALDDFGTGYSSLTYLRELPVTELKIDRSFVQFANNEPRDRLILEQVASLGRGLGLNVVAEGVEDHATLEMLRDTACVDVQGYLVSKPLPPARVPTWIRSTRPADRFSL